MDLFVLLFVGCCLNLLDCIATELYLLPVCKGFLSASVHFHFKSSHSSFLILLAEEATMVCNTVSISLFFLSSLLCLFLCWFALCDLFVQLMITLLCAVFRNNNCFEPGIIDNIFCAVLLYCRSKVLRRGIWLYYLGWSIGTVSLRSGPLN
jgi:hypothetical protein